ncbi:MAG: hypothetical protein GQ474_09585 [Sulfurimonas sp.]|nr:hypothetical protein [Sulfurimonas sp.]
MKNTLKELNHGNHEIKISFDITEHGHSFGVPRNYDLKQIKALIYEKTVQDAVKNGYAICMYGHGARDKAQGYLANEKNHTTGEVQEPIGKITSLAINGKLISYTVKIVKTVGNKAQSVIDLMKGGIGGFSFVWDLPNKVFYGSDFVISPNFNGNRVVMDSLCSGGECQLGSAINDTVLDAIGEHTELYETAKDLLESQANVMGAISIKDKVTAMQDEISALKEEIEEKNIIIENKDIDIQGEKELLENEKKAHQIALDCACQDAEKSKEIKAKNEELEEKNTVLEDTFKTYGVKDDNGSLVLDTSAFGELLAKATKSFNQKVDDTTLDSLREVSKPSANPADFTITY